MSLNRRVWLRLNDDDMARLDDIASREDRPRSQMLRVIVRNAIDKDDTEYNKNKRRINEDD